MAATDARLNPHLDSRIPKKQHSAASNSSLSNDNQASAGQAILEQYANQHADKPLTALQKHVLFWDRDCDGIIWPQDVFNGFRELGFNFLFSLGSLLIPIFFSYPTRFAYSWLPDPYFRIYVQNIKSAKHGSDTGIYSFDGHFNGDRFDALFAYFDASETGSLGVADLFRLLSKNRVAADPAGWSFSFMEWWTTWVLLQNDGRVWKDDLKACYDGSLFWQIREERTCKTKRKQGYGLGELMVDLWKGRTWSHWGIPE